MNFFQQLMLATVLFSFTITGMSIHASKAHAGAQDGRFHLKCETCQVDVTRSHFYR